MMARERITRQGEWLGLNGAAAYTLYQARAQITLRLKTEHANAQESLWHRNKEWATIFPSPSLSPTLAHTLFITFLLSNFLFSPPRPRILPRPLLRRPCFWGTTLLYGHSYCSSDSVMCIYCSICEIGGSRRQACYYSITEAGHFHNRGLSSPPDRNVTSLTNNGRICCIVVVAVVAYIGGEVLGESVNAQHSTRRLILHERAKVWRVDLFQNRLWRLLPCTCPTGGMWATPELWPCPTRWSIGCQSASQAHRAGPSEISPSHCPSSPF